MIKIIMNKMKWVLVGLLLLPSMALAASSGEFEAVNILGQLVKLLNSEIARIIFVLAIVGIGYGWLYLGRIPQGRAIGAIIGIGIVFSAGYIARMLGVEVPI